MNKLKETDFTFLQIVYAIWQLLFYYEDYYAYIAPATPLSMDVELLYRAGTPFIQVTIPRVHCTKIPPDTSQMRDVMQQYLDYVIMPVSGIKPYAGGSSIYDIVEPLRINYISLYSQNLDMILVEFIYVCDPLSFSLYKKNQQVPKI